MLAALRTVYDTERTTGAPAADAGLEAALRMLPRISPRRGQVVVVSDFLDGDRYAKPLRALAVRHAAARPLTTAWAAAWSEGRAVQAGAVLPWGDAPGRDPRQAGLGWAVPAVRERAGALPWGDPPARQRATRAPWDASIRPRQPRAALPFNDPPPRELAPQLAFRSTRAIPTAGAGAGVLLIWIIARMRRA